MRSTLSETKINTKVTQLAAASRMCDPGRCLTPWFWFLGDRLRTRFR